MGEEKTKKLIKSKRSNCKKKPIRILKKPTSSVWFRFSKPETKPKQKNRKKLSQTSLNQFLF